MHERTDGRAVACCGSISAAAALGAGGVCGGALREVGGILLSQSSESPSAPRLRVLPRTLRVTALFARSTRTAAVPIRVSLGPTAETLLELIWPRLCTAVVS